MEEEKPGMHYDADPGTFRNAYRLRQRETEAEQVLWERLRRKQVLGLKFRRQHPVSKYVLDFYCHRARLGLEIDGEYHDTTAQQLYDKLRTEALEALEIKVIRFANKGVLEDTDAVVAEIERVLRELV